MLQRMLSKNSIYLPRLLAMAGKYKTLQAAQTHNLILLY